MPRRNRVDPWGDLRADPARGLFTGNRGCVVDGHEQVVRHHATNLLWITCRLEFRGWRVPLARPRRWTPLFFLDDAVALSAGHRPCSTCRRENYVGYRDAVTLAVGAAAPLRATDLNARLAGERLRAGRGLDRAGDRKTWWAPLERLPPGTVVLDPRRQPCLLSAAGLQPFGFAGWGPARAAGTAEVEVLTPETSVAALRHGFVPVLHPSAADAAAAP